MTVIQPFSPEQERALINLRQRYEVWIEAERELARMPYDLRRKKVGDREYLYEIFDRGGNGKSLGAWDDEKQVQFEDYRTAKATAKERRDGAREALHESSRIARALRLPMLSADAGPILREADRRALLGSHLLVVGTNAMAAFALEAAGAFRNVPDETEDFDLAWTARSPKSGRSSGTCSRRSIRRSRSTASANSRPAMPRLTRWSCSSLRPGSAPWRGRTDRGLCRCRSRNGCCRDAGSTRSSPAAMVLPRGSLLPILGRLRSTSSGSAPKPSATLSSAGRTSRKATPCSMPWPKPCLTTRLAKNS